MSPAAKAAASSPQQLAKFSVFVLGMRGAGKTVFVSSMYRLLMAYSGKRGYFLRCKNEQLSAELIDTFKEVETDRQRLAAIDSKRQGL
jgi:predicted AAA+ superfamily ATPase